MEVEIIDVVLMVRGDDDSRDTGRPVLLVNGESDARGAIRFGYVERLIRERLAAAGLLDDGESEGGEIDDDTHDEGSTDTRGT